MRRKRILLLSRYGRLGASSRLRTIQYVPHLAASGYEIVQAPLLDDWYINGLYSDRVRHASIVRAYLARISSILRTRDIDAVWLEKELLPWAPGVLELSLLPRRIPILVDYDDAIFHRYDSHRSWLVRRLLGAKLDGVMARAALVLAGNDYLAARARAAGCRQVEVVPTVVDLERYPRRKKQGQNHPPVIGWIGSPNTVNYMMLAAPLLERLRSRYEFRCVAIGARPDQVEGTVFEAVPWTEDSEVRSLESLDVGIMPLLDTPWERGKCGYKLIQYMAVGIPVVASPVGANRGIVHHGKDGFLAGSDAEWEDALGQLLRDQELRTKLGEAGREKVEGTYALQVQAPRIESFFDALVG